MWLSDKIGFKTKTLIRDKESNDIMIKGSILQEDVMLVNIYAPNLGAPKYIEQILTGAVARRVKNLPTMQETWIQSLGQVFPTWRREWLPTPVIAWRIPWIEEYGGLTVHGTVESDTTEWLSLSLFRFKGRNTHQHNNNRGLCYLTCICGWIIQIEYQ